MSDYSSFTLIVFDAPEDQHEAILEIINEHGLTEDYFGDKPEDELDLGTTYGGEMNLAAYEDVAKQIIEAAPGATFECWNDPKYEYDGAITMYVPDLGTYTSACNANGETYLTARQVRDALMAGDLSTVLGAAWIDRIDELREKLERYR